ncbi:hypothetical protein STABA_v1c03950 [Spiroplasma tabanidicola]|uniref:Uncharacterized protein n=1 Tax=Spiroplasma tabanidicola TaxID=324079 RepID=A0A6I6CBZ8_9MOLU|nr:hypothetical protein STABA_v1c03950 [Spiroplasma tabanidicola]
MFAVCVYKLKKTVNYEKENFTFIFFYSCFLIFTPFIGFFTNLIYFKRVKNYALSQGYKYQ